MKKSQFIFAVATALEEMTEKSVKIYFLKYHGHVNKLEIDVCKNVEAYAHSHYSRFVKMEWETPEEAEQLLGEILSSLIDIAAIPDSPVEKMVTIQIPESRAKELGVA